MISKLRSWYLHRKAVRAERDYQRGFDYAAGQVMRFHHDPAAMRRIRYEADGALDGEPRHPFNQGMQDAIANFEQHMRALMNGAHNGHSSFE